MTSEYPGLVFYNGNTFSQKPKMNLSQLDAIVAKIHSFEKLRTGWHFGRGLGIWGAASVTAQRIAATGVQNGYEVEIFPGPDQDILIALRKGKNYYEVIANADSTISYFLETSGVETLRSEDDNRLPEEIEHHLNQENAFIWYTFASFFQNTGTPKSDDLSASHSKTRPMYLENGGSPLSTANA